MTAVTPASNVKSSIVKPLELCQGSASIDSGPYDTHEIAEAVGNHNYRRTPIRGAVPRVSRIDREESSETLIS